MSPPLSNVAIIGAGLGGCALALALSQHSIPVTLYESRSATSEPLKSGVILTPNGLRILDSLSILPRIKSRCWITAHRVFKDSHDVTTSKTLISHDTLYGYSNHRIWRKLLLEELRLALHERGVPIHFDSRFGSILSDTPAAVTFTINSAPISASLLIGADGLHSTVRDHVAPGVEPEYTGVLGILSHIKRGDVAWPSEDYEKNATIQGEPGAIFWIPEDEEAREIMVGMQVKYPEPSREALRELQEDREGLVGFYTREYGRWGETARKVIDEVVRRKETAYAWPYMRMPRLERWYSRSGRVVMVGDGAHALPPSSGQGVNQALEDAYSLMLLLKEVSGGGNGEGEKKEEEKEEELEKKLLSALAFWQEMRQERIDGVNDWATNTMNVMRLPEAERRKLIDEGKFQQGAPDDMGWLYGPKLEDVVAAWIDENK